MMHLESQAGSAAVMVSLALYSLNYDQDFRSTGARE